MNTYIHDAYKWLWELSNLESHANNSMAEKHLF